MSSTKIVPNLKTGRTGTELGGELKRAPPPALPTAPPLSSLLLCRLHASAATLPRCCESLVALPARTSPELFRRRPVVAAGRLAGHTGVLPLRTPLLPTPSRCLLHLTDQINTPEKIPPPSSPFTNHLAAFSEWAGVTYFTRAADQWAHSHRYTHTSPCDTNTCCLFVF